MRRKKGRFLRRVCRGGILAAAVCCLLPPSVLWADNWQASIYENSAPQHLVGVDKKRHIFNFFEKKSPFKLRYSYPCVTGQLPGDKMQINDLRTPEGIYFVEYKIAQGLDFREYGGIAYTLNYPNPVDRLRGKTGHGIWIHSKGFGLTPTRGCVAIDLDHIAEVGPLLTPGTPVILAEELRAPAGKDDENLDTLRRLMGEWSNAWAARSHKLFDFYDADAYTRATENFDAFRKNKERLFKILSFIKIYNREIHVLEGPGYWVTWSEQFYTASNLSTEGVRRLYWQKDGKGDFRIVGMEWTPRDLGLEAAFRQGKLVAEAPASIATDAASEAPRAPALDMPELAPNIEPQPEVKDSREFLGMQFSKDALLAFAEKLQNLAEPLLPRSKGKAVVPDEIVWGKGERIREAPAEDIQPAPPPAKPSPALELPAAPKVAPSKLGITDYAREEIASLTRAWRQNFQERSKDMPQFYDAKQYNRMPRASGIPRGQSLNGVMQAMRRDFRQPWLAVLSREPRVSGTTSQPKSEMDILVVTPQGMRQGVQSLWWARDDEGKYKIVASEFKPAVLGLEAAYLDEISGPITEMLEAWRRAWQAGQLDDYASFYTANASQQGRVGSANIKRQKQSLWERVRPVEVRLSGLRIYLDGAGARADMTQVYANSSGHTDKGTKTLALVYDGRNWRIQREDWSALPPNSPS